MKHVFVISSLVTIISVVGIVMLLNKNGSNIIATSSGQTNVSIVDGKQVIHIDAKGGYAPRNTLARANMPTLLNVKTSGTYDCSSELSIPRLGYRSSLPPSGVTSIEIPPQPAGTTMKGTCAMGMYHFSVVFN